MFIRKYRRGSIKAFMQYVRWISFPARKLTASKQHHVFFLVTLTFLVSSGKCLSFSGGEPMEIILRTEVQVDLFFHCLAHMDIGQDASSLYSQAYMSRISREKIQNSRDPAWLASEMDKIKDIYIPDQKLRMVNFLPFQFMNVEQLLEGLKWLSGDLQGNSPQPFLPFFKQRYFSSPGAQSFLRTLTEILVVEYQTFYREFWKRQNGQRTALKKRFRTLFEESGLKLLGPALKGKKDVIIYLCLSMTRNGRGFSSGAYFGAAVKFPEEENEIMRSFFFSIHEMTHLFLDEWTLRQSGYPDAPGSTRSGDEGYDIHLLKESAVLYADYLLCKKILPTFLTDYLLTFLELSGEGDRGNLARFLPTKLEKLFKARISLTAKTGQLLETFIWNLLNSRESVPDMQKEKFGCQPMIPRNFPLTNLT